MHDLNRKKQFRQKNFITLEFPPIVYRASIFLLVFKVFLSFAQDNNKILTLKKF